MSDLEKTSSKSRSSSIKTNTSTGLVSNPSQTGSCSMGDLLLRSEKSWNDEAGEKKDPIDGEEHNDTEKNKRQATGGCPMGEFHEGMLRWERNTLGEEEDGDDELEPETVTTVLVNNDIGDAQMNI